MAGRAKLKAADYSYGDGHPMDENKLRLLTVMTACLFFVFAFGLIGSLIMLLRSDSHAQMKPSAVSGMNPGTRINAMNPSIITSGKRGVSAVKVSDLRFEVYDQESGNEHQQDAPSPTPASFEKCPSGAPGSKIKLLIAIMSECCNMASRRKRDAIRQTWLRDAMREHGDVLGVKFLLSTPKVSGAEDIAKYQKHIPSMRETPCTDLTWQDLKDGCTAASKSALGPDGYGPAEMALLSDRA